jgi:outer membrane lipoprotein-sorting protein
VGALIVGGTLVGTAGVSADSGLPQRTASELLVDLQDPQATALSGTVVTKADLGLPDLPMGMASSAGLTSLVSGSNTLRVWTAGPDQTRVALIGSAEETDVVHSGRDVWVWSSSGKTAEHYVMPDRDASAPSRTVPGSMDLPSTPQEAADLVLKALDGTTDVSTSGVASVAGRPVYELILTPRQSDTLVERVVIAIDAETSTPLRVQVFSTVMPEPAFEIGFTSVDFTEPDASVFAFTPPPGATVTEHADAMAGSATKEPAGTPGDPGVEPTVVGTGWSQVVVATLPADQLASLAGGVQDTAQGGGASADALALLESLPRTTGAWGSGRILSGTLLSAILTDDGRIAIGAVAPETLGAALAAQ